MVIMTAVNSRFTWGFCTCFLVTILSLVVPGCSADEDASRCPRICLNLRQGSRYYGQFYPISTKTSVEDFYNYHHYSFNGDDIVPLLRDQSLFLIHHDSRSCKISFVIVHDSKEDSTGGQAHFLVSGNHENALVQDGPGDGSKSDRYVYRGYSNTTDDRTELFWEWGWQEGETKKYRTDGMADRWNPDDGCLSVSAKFIKGIDAWRFVFDPDGGTTRTMDPNNYLFLDQDETLRVCKVDCS